MDEDYKYGDRIWVKPRVFWKGQDLSYKDGTVQSAEGHLVVYLDNYQDNPVKLFRYEVFKHNKQSYDQEEPDFSWGP
jgi:hypothetical protein